MSINAISSVSLYEYYYTINNNKEKDKKSPLADEMKRYGLTPTDDEVLNAAMLQRAKQAKEAQNSEAKENKESKTDRPWADIMYQLNLSFNDNPLDDIEDIKDELAKLLSDIKDDELEQEITDLEDYVEKLYITYTKNNVSSKSLLTVQMNTMSNLNKVRMI